MGRGESRVKGRGGCDWRGREGCVVGMETLRLVFRVRGVVVGGMGVGESGLAHFVSVVGPSVARNMCRGGWRGNNNN